MARKSPPPPFECTLCKRGGQPTLAPRFKRSAICEDHAEALAATGRAWCNRGAHVVPIDEMSRAECKRCKAAYNARYYAEHAERERQRARDRYHADPQAHMARAKVWRNTPEGRARHTAYTHAWRHRNLEHWRATRRIQEQRRRERNREHFRLKSRDRYQQRKLRALRSMRRAA